MLFVLCEGEDVNKKLPEPARMMKTAGNGWA